MYVCRQYKTVQLFYIGSLTITYNILCVTILVHYQMFIFIPE